MQFDDIFQHIGDFGVYQVCMYCIIGMIPVFSGMQNLAMTFVGGVPEHWCHVPALANFTFSKQKYIAIPSTPDGQHERCAMFDMDFSNYTQHELQTWNRSATINVTTRACGQWRYDQSVFVSSVVTEWDLVCTRSWMIQLLTTVWMAGRFAGALTCGFFSDRFGRKITTVVSLLGSIVFSFAGSFAPNYATFVLLRFLTSIFLTSCITSAFIICMELIGPSCRFITGVLFNAWFSLGFMLLPGIAYFVRDFQRLQWILSLPCVVLISLSWLLPESPRWLILKGQHQKAENILKKIAEVNRKSLPEVMEFDTEKEDTEGRKATLVDIFKSKTLAMHTLIQYLGWFTASLIYYGLSFNAGKLAGDLFLNTFLLGLVEIPANTICVLAVGKLGRRMTVGGSLIIASVASFSTMPLLYQPSLGWLTTTVALIGKAASTVTFSALYVYSAELFPTVVRNTGVGSCSSSARVSGMAAPYVGGPLDEVWKPLPSLVFGAFAALSGGLAFFLPETLNRVIPETIEEAEKLSRSTKKNLTVKSSKEMDLNQITMKEEGLDTDVDNGVILTGVTT